MLDVRLDLFELRADDDKVSLIAPYHIDGVAMAVDSAKAADALDLSLLERENMAVAVGTIGEIILISARDHALQPNVVHEKDLERAAGDFEESRVLIAASLDVARAKRGFAKGRDPRHAAGSNPDVYEPLNFQALVARGYVKRFTTSNAKAEQAFAGTPVARAGATDSLDKPFINLWIGELDAPVVGRNPSRRRGLCAPRLRPRRPTRADRDLDGSPGIHGRRFRRQRHPDAAFAGPGRGAGRNPRFRLAKAVRRDGFACGRKSAFSPSRP